MICNDTAGPGYHNNYRCCHKWQSDSHASGVSSQQGAAATASTPHLQQLVKGLARLLPMDGLLEAAINLHVSVLSLICCRCMV